MTHESTAESLNKGHFGTVFLSFVRRLSSLESPKCIGTIGWKYLRTSSCVLFREIVFILERPLSEIPLYLWWPLHMDGFTIDTLNFMVLCVYGFA